MFAGCQTVHFIYNLLGLARASCGQVRRCARLAINLNFDFSGARFFRRDDLDAAAAEWTAPDIAGSAAGGEVVVEISGAQIAAANPADIPRARIIVVDPTFVVGDSQDTAHRREGLIRNA